MSAVNVYICYTLDWWSRDLNSNFTLGNCLFGSLKLTRNADADKYQYRGYTIGYDSRSQFLFAEGSTGKNTINFGVDMAHLCMLVIMKKIS